MTIIARAILTHKTVWLFATLLLMIITGAVVGWSGKCLETPSAPYGIVSLELAWADEEAQKLKTEWSEYTCKNNIPVVEQAKVNILWDFLFLIGYPLFLIVLVVLLGDYQRAGATSMLTPIGFYLAMAAGVLDGIENLFMLQFLRHKDWPAFSFALPANLKFFFIVVVVLIILVMFIKKIFHWKRT